MVQWLTVLGHWGQGCSAIRGGADALQDRAELALTQGHRAQKELKRAPSLPEP